VPTTTRTLDATLAAIAPLDERRRAAAWARLDALTKPRRSLGRLEELAATAATVLGDRRGKKSVLVFAGDHGVTAEGVSAYPAEVTAQMVANFAAGGAAVNVIARQHGIDVVVVDVGVASAAPPPAGVVVARIAPGTRNMLREPAMTADEARRALEVGIAVATREAERGVVMIALGEMGIGNTTAATAIAAALLGVPAATVVGPGTGLDPAGVARKQEVVTMALAHHRLDATRPLDVLAAVGGFEIAAIAGACLGAAAAGCVVVVDGFIASAGALVALRLAPAARPYCVFAHRSPEPGHAAILAALAARPLLDLEMRLGEGTGACLGIALVETSLRVLDEMATFESAGVAGRRDRGADGPVER
jgi:nicotinate-nucleotide--dimethylbenzimidazole phosphoribosyltransferase